MEHIRSTGTPRVVAQHTPTVAELRAIASPSALIHRRVELVMLASCRTSKIVPSPHQIVLSQGQFGVAHLYAVDASSVRVHVDLGDLVIVPCAHHRLDVPALRSVASRYHSLSSLSHIASIKGTAGLKALILLALVE